MAKQNRGQCIDAIPPSFNCRGLPQAIPLDEVDKATQHCRKLPVVRMRSRVVDLAVEKDSSLLPSAALRVEFREKTDAGERQLPRRASQTSATRRR